MATVFQETPNRLALEPLRTNSGWIVALGIVYVIAGLIALSSVVFATTVTMFVVGVVMLISGIAEVITAFQFRSWGKFLLWLVLGLLYIVAGLATFENPHLAAAVLTLLLGLALIFSGAMRMILAFGMNAWAWMLLSGFVTFLLGIVILAHWPVSSLYVLGVLLGVQLLIVGIGWIFVGSGVKSRA